MEGKFLGESQTITPLSHNITFHVIIRRKNLKMHIVNKDLPENNKKIKKKIFQNQHLPLQNSKKKEKL